VSSNASEGGTILDSRKDETVDAELDRLVEKRARTGDPEAVHELWKGSVRRYH
jgi:hypothetical protein